MAKKKKKRKKSMRGVLVNDLRGRFVDYFVGKGFEQAPLLHDDALLQGAKRHMPLGCLKRVRNGYLEVILVIFDTKAAPKFVIMFGEIPPEGIRMLLPEESLVPQNQAGLMITNPLKFLRGPTLNWDFSFKFRLFQRKNEKNAKKIIDIVMDRAPQIEEWYQKGRIGKNVTLSEPPYDNSEPHPDPPHMVDKEE
jgi:hypothetical protein